MKGKRILKTTLNNKEYKRKLKDSVMAYISIYGWCGVCKGPCGFARDSFYPYRFKRMVNSSKRGAQKPRYKNIDRRSLKEFN